MSDERTSAARSATSTALSADTADSSDTVDLPAAEPYGTAPPEQLGHTVVDLTDRSGPPDADDGAADLVPGMVTVVEAVEPPAAAPAGDQFDLVFRGYERHQVDNHMARVGSVVDQLQVSLAAGAQREAELGAELDRTRAELERGRPTFDALGERVTQILGLAETEAAQLRADAEQAAADIRSDARRDAEELGAAARREVADLGRRRVELLGEIAAMRDTLNGILGAAGEQWPSLTPHDEGSPDLSG